MKIKIFIIIAIGIVFSSCGKETIELSNNLKEIYNIYDIGDEIQFFKNKQDTIIYSITNKIIDEYAIGGFPTKKYITEEGIVYSKTGNKLVLVTVDGENEFIKINFEYGFYNYRILEDTIVKNITCSKVYEFTNFLNDTLYMSQKEGIFYANVSNNIYELIQ